MSVPALVLAIMAYAIVGMVVVESLRIHRFWWLTFSLGTLIWWPLLLFIAIFGRKDCP